MCKYPSNEANVKSCEICDFKAPRTKMGMKVNGRFVLMSVCAAKPPEKCETLRVFDVTQDTWHSEVELDRGSDNLEARVRTTIVHTLGHKIHRPWSRAAPKMGSWEDEEEPEPDDEEDEEDTAFDDGESGSRKKSASSAHVPISLFDQVLRGASEQVYDPHIGQYVEKTAIEADAKVEDEQTQSDDGKEEQPAFHGMDQDFNYVKSMRRERDVMKERVQVYNQVVSEARAAEIEQRIIEKKDLANSAVLPRNMHQNCALCLQQFHPRNLMGSVAFNAVAEWRASHGEPFPEDDSRLKLQRRYEPVRLCVFCMQFFDKDFVEYVEYHKGTTRIDDPVLSLEGNHADSELDVSVTKRLAGRPTKNAEILIERPGSPVFRDVAFLHLRTMREKPLLMEQVGCQLAKWSNPDNRVKLNFVKPSPPRRKLSNAGSTNTMALPSLSDTVPVSLGGDLASLGSGPASKPEKMALSMSADSASLASLRSAKAKKKRKRKAENSDPAYVPIWQRAPKKKDAAATVTQEAPFGTYLPTEEVRSNAAHTRFPTIEAPSADRGPPKPAAGDGKKARRDLQEAREASAKVYESGGPSSARKKAGRKKRAPGPNEKSKRAEQLKSVYV